MWMQRSSVRRLRLHVLRSLGGQTCSSKPRREGTQGCFKGVGLKVWVSPKFHNIAFKCRIAWRACFDML